MGENYCDKNNILKILVYFILYFNKSKEINVFDYFKLYVLCIVCICY